MQSVLINGFDMHNYYNNFTPPIGKSHNNYKSGEIISQKKAFLKRKKSKEFCCLDSVLSLVAI